MSKKSTLNQEGTQQNSEKEAELNSASNQTETANQPNTGNQPGADSHEVSAQHETGNLCRPYTFGKTSVNDLAFIYIQTLIELSEPHCKKFCEEEYWDTEYEKVSLLSQDRLRALFGLISQGCSYPEAKVLATALKAETKGLTLRLNCLDDLIDIYGREWETWEWYEQVRQHRICNQEIASDITLILNHLPATVRDSTPQDDELESARAILEEIQDKTQEVIDILDELEENINWFRYSDFQSRTYNRLETPLRNRGFCTDNRHDPLYELVVNGEAGEAPIVELYEVRKRLKWETAAEAWKPFPTVAENFRYSYYDSLQRRYEDAKLMCRQEATNGKIVQFFKQKYLQDAGLTDDEKPTTT